MVVDGHGEGQSARALGEEEVGDRSRIGAHQRRQTLTPFISPLGTTFHKIPASALAN